MTLKILSRENYILRTLKEKNKNNWKKEETLEKLIFKKVKSNVNAFEEKLLVLDGLIKKFEKIREK